MIESSLEPGSLTLELRLPRLAPTRYALAALKDANEADKPQIVWALVTRKEPAV